MIIGWLAVDAGAEADVRRKVILSWLAVEAEAYVGRKVILGWLAVEADAEADVGRKMIPGTWLASNRG